MEKKKRIIIIQDADKTCGNNGALVVTSSMTDSNHLTGELILE